jgi:hypothetical protein
VNLTIPAKNGNVNLPQSNSIHKTSDCKSGRLFSILYNAQFHNPHPFIHLVISVLKKAQEKTCTKIRSASKGCFNKMALADKQRLYHTINEYNEYLIYTNIIKYLF